MKRVFYWINGYERNVPRESRGCQFRAMQNIVLLRVYTKNISKGPTFERIEMLGLGADVDSEIII